jgi:hypothetical protein
MNLLLRWGHLIETSNEALLRQAKKNKKISEIPPNSVKKLEALKKIFKKDKELIKTLEFYEMLRKLDGLKTERSGEFRKNVNLRIFYRGEEINVDLEKLKEYAEILEKFISRVKQYLVS